jgi:hypothetical protein
MRSTLLAAIGAMLLACSTQGVSRNLYEGIRFHNESQRGTPREVPPAPTFDQYERERRAETSRRDS